MQVIDILAAALFFGYIAAAYTAWRKRDRREMDQPERAMATSSVGTFITISVAGASILLSGAAVLLGLGSGNDPIPKDFFTELTLASFWLVLSLGCGVVSAAYVLSHLHSPLSAAEHPLIMTFATAQLVAMLIGGLFLSLSFFLF